MKYFIEKKESGDYGERLKREGYSLTQKAEEADIIVAIGGDGTVLRAARRCEEPTILPVRKESSKGHKMEVKGEELFEAIAALEDGKYRLEEKERIAAYKDGEEIHGDFKALNEVQLHHKRPGSAVKFKAEIIDEENGLHFEEHELIGDGIIVSTPFGSTGYHRTVSGEVIEKGLGVAFNHIHTPEDCPNFIKIGENGFVKIQVLEEGRGILLRDNDPKHYEPKEGEKIKIRGVESPVSIVKVDLK